MTTSVWPSDAIARADANGSIVSKVPLVTLDDAASSLTTNSAIVARLTVARPRDTTRLDPRGTERRGSVEPACCALAIT